MCFSRPDLILIGASPCPCCNRNQIWPNFEYCGSSSYSIHQLGWNLIHDCSVFFCAKDDWYMMSTALSQVMQISPYFWNIHGVTYPILIKVKCGLRIWCFSRNFGLVSVCCRPLSKKAAHLTEFWLSLVYIPTPLNRSWSNLAWKSLVTSQDSHFQAK